MSKNSTYDIFAQSFFNLTIFRPCLTKMMSACKARALDEGGMMQTSLAQSLHFDEFFHVLVTSYLEFSPGLKIQCQSDPEPPPGRKSRQGIEIYGETFSKSSKLEKFKKSRKTAETSGFINFAPSNMHFRSADAANHLNARPRDKIRVTRSIYP